MIGRSGTGTGKTIAFAVPAVEKIDSSSNAVQAYDRQTILFSATMQPGIKRLAQALLKNPLMIKSTPENPAVPAIDQAYMEVMLFP